MYGYQETFIYASLSEEVPPMVKSTIDMCRVMITVSVGGEWLIYADSLDPNEPFSQDDFIGFAWSDLKKLA
jgi:hypothetical protein